MFEFEINESVILEQQKAIEAALSTGPKAEKVLRKIIRKYILEARQQVVNSITFKHGDPRGARNSIRSTVYKKIFGANLNIYNMHKAHRDSTYEPPRKLRPGQRGGNRVKRGGNTIRWMTYGPLDRGAVLRWLNEGTGDRTAGTRGGRLSGNRGSIAARNFFKPLGDRALGRMRDNLAKAIEEEMAKLLPHD
jgi:hypothetical protein